jgi:hypothetical protein
LVPVTEWGSSDVYGSSFGLTKVERDHVLKLFPKTPKVRYLDPDGRKSYDFLREIGILGWS